MPFVVFGNKIDKKDSLKEEELREVLGLHFHSTYGKDVNQKNQAARPIEIFMCSVMKRVGYADGFQWLANFIKWLHYQEKAKLCSSLTSLYKSHTCYTLQRN